MNADDDTLARAKSLIERADEIIIANQVEIDALKALIARFDAIIAERRALLERMHHSQ